MLNFVMFALGLGFFSGFPKPDLVSVDYTSIQAGAGFVWNFPDFNHPQLFLRPDLGFSMGQVRVYWGKRLAFATGLEVMRIEAGFPFVPEYFMFRTCELVMPQVGVSYVFGSARPRLIASSSVLGESYIPRLDLVCGFSPMNIFSELYL